MKTIKLIIFLLILTQCSFDNKTGIWTNDNEIIKKKNIQYKDFKTINSNQKKFDTIITPPQNFKISFGNISINENWLDEFYNKSNNLENFSYTGLNNIIFKSSKLSRKKLKNSILFDNEKVITSDEKGNVIIYSITNKKNNFKFNFYHKKYKKIKKVLNIIIKNNITYISDNLGYVYALDYKSRKLLWAKNYKIPFRSNIKISKNNLILADQNNTLYILNRRDGEVKRRIPSEEAILKNYFINSIAVDDDSIFYLNTFGTLYSINSSSLRLNWFTNFNQSTTSNSNNLFYSNPLLIYKNNILISSNPNLYVVDKISGSTSFKKNINSILKPIISGNHIFTITDNHILVCVNLITGKIIYSIDISREIGIFLETKNKPISIKSISQLNNELYIFLDNSYVVKFDMRGKINDIFKLPGKLASSPIFVNQSIIYFDKNNKILIIN